jgi:hypothetical protein
MFPTLDFSLSGYDLLNDWGFRGTIRDGKLELLDARLIWETIDGLSSFVIEQQPPTGGPWPATQTRGEDR